MPGERSTDPNTLTVEALATEALGYVGDALALPKHGPNLERIRMAGILTDVAYFGHPADVSRAGGALVTMAGTADLSKPLSGTQIRIMEEFASLAVAIDGDFLQRTKEVVTQIAPQPHHITREKLMVQLATSGDPDIVAQATKEVLSAGFGDETMDWLMRLDEFSDQDLAAAAIGMSRGLPSDEAISWLRYRQPKEGDDTFIEEIKRRFAEINPNDLPVESDEAKDLDSYTFDLYTMFQLTGEEQYKEAFLYFIKELRDTPEKVNKIAYAADMCEDAPQMIRESAAARNPDGKPTDRDRVALVSALAKQQNFEQAMEEAAKIEDREEFVLAHTSIVNHGGFHLIAKVIGAVVPNLGADAPPQATDSPLVSIAFATIWDGPATEAHKVIPHLRDPANKIRVIRGIAQALNGAPAEQIWI